MNLLATLALRFNEASATERFNLLFGVLYITIILGEIW